VKPLVVTGLGIVCPIGIGREAFVAAMREGARASHDEGKVDTFDASKYPGARVAEVRGFEPSTYLGERGLRSLDRLCKLLLVAARLCLHDAGLKKSGVWMEAKSGARAWGERVGMVVSNAYGSLEAISELDRVALLEDPRYINPSRFPLTVSNSAAGYASIWEDLRALNVSVSNGNCGSLDAVACADAFLQSGRADALLVGGAEAMSEALFVAFRRLGADFGSSKPPGASTGCLGEGAAFVALETAGGARARAAEPLGEMIGYGTSFAPPPREAALVYAGREALEQAIDNALVDAGVAKQDIDIVISGISGMRPFDEAELLAIRSALGDDARVMAPKMAMGETLGAGGALAISAAIACFKGAVSACMVRGPVRGPVRTALITSMGYYGDASALVMRRASK
jgi:3-oxoacyl-(acyl-carrier-protein) synthase